jgi:phasin family protein
MADPKDKTGSAEQAYADAASQLKPEVAAPEVEAVEPAPAKVVALAEKAETSKTAPPAKKLPSSKVTAKKKTPAKKATPAKTKAKPAPKPAEKKTTVARRKPAARRKPIAVAKKPAAKTVAAKKAPTVIELKEMIMATKTKDFTEMMSKSVNEAVVEMQAKAQEAYEKGTSLVSEMTEAAKGNVEAVVESGKIMAAGAQDLGKTYADEAKAAYETLTADLKEMASVKSPTDLFQLQGKIMRRNFDAMVASTSKGTESAMKLANDVFAPISARVNVAVEKISKAA